MEQSSEIKLRDDDSDTAAAVRAKRLAGPNRRAQVLRTASAQFAMTGLRGTTTLAVAQAAGISEAILYVHFGNKTQLFREAVEINSETRLRSLDSDLASIGADGQIDWIGRATDLYRNEIGSIRGFWDREVARRFHTLESAGSSRPTGCDQHCKISVNGSRKHVEQPTPTVYGCRIPHGIIGNCRIGGRRSNCGRHNLAESTCPGKGRASRPRNVAARRPLQGFHRRGIESVWRCRPEQRATGSGARRSRRPDQQDARPVLAANCRVR